MASGHATDVQQNSIGQIAEQSEFALEPNWKIHPPEKLWIYENFAPRNIYYFSAVLIVPLVTLIITFWSGGNVILKEKRKYPLLTFGLLIAAWAFIVLATIGLAGDIYSYYTLGGDTVISLLIILPVVYAIKLGFSLLKWGRELEREKELPGDLKNLQSKALKRSGAFLLGAIGVLLVINVAYGFSYDGGRKNYLTQSDEFVKEFQETIQKDPAQLQKVCQPPASSP